MTYTIRVKEEIAHLETDIVEALAEVSGFIRFDGEITSKEIILNIENASVARRIYKLMKMCFQIRPQITVRVQRRFRIHQLYILVYNNKIMSVLERLNIYKDGHAILPEEYFLATKEEKIAFLRGLFLATGSINNPQTSGYHMEFSVPRKTDASYVVKLLKEFNIVSKILKRKTRYMVYIKQAEMISDTLKMLGAINSMFFFEDIRIYRDHKNMVNRLNNCEIANQEKTTITGLKQLRDIAYLKNNDLLPLLDEKIQEVIMYREKYPETSYQELAEIVTMESGHSISKSGINHYFRKIKDLVNKHKEKNKN